VPGSPSRNRDIHSAGLRSMHRREPWTTVRRMFSLKPCKPRSRSGGQAVRRSGGRREAPSRDAAEPSRCRRLVRRTRFPCRSAGARAAGARSVTRIGRWHPRARPDAPVQARSEDWLSNWQASAYSRSGGPGRMIVSRRCPGALANTSCSPERKFPDSRSRPAWTVRVARTVTGRRPTGPASRRRDGAPERNRRRTLQPPLCGPPGLGEQGSRAACLLG
jgi:hypothetical protein